MSIKVSQVTSAQHFALAECSDVEMLLIGALRICAETVASVALVANASERYFERPSDMVSLLSKVGCKVVEVLQIHHVSASPSKGRISMSSGF